MVSVATGSCTQFFAPSPDQCKRCNPEDPCSSVAWIGTEGIIRIESNSGVVAGETRGLIGAPTLTIRSVHFISTARREQSPFGYLLWRAKRQWRKWFPEK